MLQVELNSKRWLSLEDFDGEEWRPVVGYENYYLVSNYGRLKSITRHTTDSLGRNSFHCGRIAKVSVNKGGYANYRICVECKLIPVLVHRLVAAAFIPNPNMLPFVNHLDENRLNNNVSNLEWITNKDNINYRDAQKRHSESLRKVLRNRTFIVVQYDLDGNEVATYRGKKEILDSGFSYDGVVHCCKGITKTHRGYIWKRFMPK